MTARDVSALHLTQLHSISSQDRIQLRSLARRILETLHGPLSSTQVSLIENYHDMTITELHDHAEAVIILVSSLEDHTR